MMKNDNDMQCDDENETKYDSSDESDEDKKKKSKKSKTGQSYVVYREKKTVQAIDGHRNIGIHFILSNQQDRQNSKIFLDRIRLLFKETPSDVTVVKNETYIKDSSIIGTGIVKHE